MKKITQNKNPFTIKNIVFIGILFCYLQDVNCQAFLPSEIIVGAEQTGSYFPLLRAKKVALAANQTSVVKEQHLADLMLANGIELQFVFSPEHGFRGNADAGQKVIDSKDPISGLPIVSLYGKHKKPTPEDLKGIEMVVFDIQDVGVRFYTYISTLHYIMEACAENHIPLMVLDRPNPNGFYVDGPVLDTSASSFVGMHPVPLVHGMTIGEYALMINEEQWLKNKIHCDLLVVPCKNYSHSTLYELPIKPSPNLPNIRSIYLYPSLGLFEGTFMSVGRGTTFPFQVYGHPDYKKNGFEYTPQSVSGAKYPKYKDKVCHGKNLQEIPLSQIRKTGFTLSYLIETYKTMHKVPDFFNSFLYRLVGSKTLQQQIEKGMTEQEIKITWQNDLQKFKKIRKLYLLYPDFE